MELNEMEKRLIFQADGYGRSEVTHELRICLPYIPDPVKRQTAAELARKLDAMPEQECQALIQDIRKNYRLPAGPKTMGELLADARRRSGAEKLKGHDIMALERFDPEVRHMIVFDVLSWESSIGDKGDKMRLFLTDAGYGVLKEVFLSGEAGSVEQISAFKKAVTGRVIPKSERERLEIFEHILSSQQGQGTPEIGRVHTDFCRNSVRMGKECEKDGGYWDSNVEMTARAFACYIKDRLPYTSDYLAGHADCAITMVTNKDDSIEILKAFPEGEERRAINAVFDEIMQDLKREHFLTHAAVTLPLAASELREAPDGQLSMFSGDRPSIMEQLAARKTAEKTTPAPKAPQKSHVPEI